MRILENRTKESKREMDILDALDEIREMTRADAKLNSDDLFNYICKRDTSDMTSEEQRLIHQKFTEMRRKRQHRLAEEKAKLDTQIQDELKKELKTSEDSRAVSSQKTLADDIAEELIGPAPLEDREPVFDKMTGLGDGLWDLHTKLIIKKHIEEPEPISEEGTEEMLQKPGYRFPQVEQPPKIANTVICDYSSSEQEEGEEEQEPN